MNATPSTTSTTTTAPAVVLTSTALDSAKVRPFTLATAAKGVSAASKSDEKALGYLAGVRQSIGKAEGEKAVAAAYAIRVGVARGWKQGDIAKEIGVSPSMATLYVRMGLAFDKGIVVGSPEWKALHSQAYANAKEVAAVLTDSDATADDVRKAVAEKVKAVADGGSDSDSSDSDGTGASTTAPDVPRGFNQKMAMIEAIIAGLPAKPSDAQFKAIERVGKAYADYARKARAARKVAA